MQMQMVIESGAGNLTQIHPKIKSLRIHCFLENRYTFPSQTMHFQQFNITQTFVF